VWCGPLSCWGGLAATFNLMRWLDSYLCLVVVTTQPPLTKIEVATQPHLSGLGGCGRSYLVEVAVWPTLTFVEGGHVATFLIYLFIIIFFQNNKSTSTPKINTELICFLKIFL
jgi:hypothetical protein